MHDFKYVLCMCVCVCVVVYCMCICMNRQQPHSTHKYPQTSYPSCYIWKWQECTLIACKQANTYISYTLYIYFSFRNVSIEYSTGTSRLAPLPPLHFNSHPIADFKEKTDQDTLCVCFISTRMTFSMPYVRQPYCYGSSNSSITLKTGSTWSKNLKHVSVCYVSHTANPSIASMSLLHCHANTQHAYWRLLLVYNIVEVNDRKWSSKIQKFDSEVESWYLFYIIIIRRTQFAV